MLVAVAHHDVPTREALKKILMSQAGCRIAWSAADSPEVVRQCRVEKPDLLLLDLALSSSGSLTIRDVMKTCKCAILLLTDSMESNAAMVFEAMGHGVLDAVKVFREKTGEMQGEKELVKKLSTIGKLIGTPEPQVTKDSPTARTRDSLPPLIAIGASTGGPKALSVILSALPADPGAAIVIVQHLDEQFSAGLAEWLSGQCALKVVVAREGDRPRRDAALIASTNDHLILGKDLALHYTGDPRNYPYRPSVDEFFGSLEKHWPRRDAAVLLTGMGRDGGAGMAVLRKAGWHTIAQDEKTSVVYGMPAAAIELGGAAEILPLDAIAPAVMKLLKGNASKG